MERYFVLDKFNTYYDWRLILTAKDIPLAEPNTNLVKIDGMSGRLDLTEALTGEVTYDNRTITATFWTDEGTRKERERLLRSIAAALHGKKIKIVEPDDPDHYFVGRVKIKGVKNILPYAEFSIEAACEPWRYANEETARRFEINSLSTTAVVINNGGVKTLYPEIAVVGTIHITYEGRTVTLSSGSYKITDLKLRQGANVVGVSGSGSVTFTYREADL